MNERREGLIDYAGKDMAAVREQRMKEILDPAHSALLIVDLQNDFISPDGKAATLWHQNIAPMQAVLPKIEKVEEEFYRLGRPVIRTVLFEDPELRTEAGIDRFIFFEDGNREGEVACLKGTSGAQLYKPAREGDYVIEKTRASAYAGTQLAEIIKKEGLKTIFIVGIKTQRCVRRTVEDLYENEPDLHVVVLEDCVASDEVDQHESAISELKKFWPPVISSEVLIESWKHQ